MRQQRKYYGSLGRRLWILAVAAVLLLLLAYSVYALESNRRHDTITPSAAEGEIEKTISITFWTPFSGGDISFMQELVQQYNDQNPDHIRVTMKNNKLDDYYTKLSTAIVTEEAPDVAVVHASMYAQYVPARFITDISSAASSAGVQWERYNPSILQRTVIKGNHYGLPLDTHFSVLYYNKKWLQQAGVYKDGQVIMKPGEKGFMEFLQTIQRKVPEDVAPLAVPNVRIDSLWLWWSLYAQMQDGGVLYTPDGSRAALNMPAARQSLELVASLYDQKLIPPDISNATSQFAQGRAALLFLGVWSIGSFEQVDGLDFGVMPFPQIYDQPGSWGDAHTLAFPAHSAQNPERLAAALKFAQWLTEHGAVWGKAGHVPAVRDQAASEAYLSLPYRREYAGAANSVEYFPEHPKQSEVSDALVNELEKLWYGKQTVDQMLNRLDPLINGILKE